MESDARRGTLRWAYVVFAMAIALVSTLTTAQGQADFSEWAARSSSRTKPTTSSTATSIATTNESAAGLWPGAIIRRGECRMATDYTKKFFEAPLTFMEKYPIAPTSQVDGNNGRTALDLDTSGFAPNINTLTSQPPSIRYARMMQGEKVAYISLYKDKQMGGRSGTEQEGIGAMRFDASYDETTGWQPIYFLPWDTTGAIIRLSIPAKGVLRTDPDIFFTATINGCSVFIQGDPDRPTVYHAGGNTGQSDHNEAARFWRDALRKHIAKSASARARGVIATEVNKTEYIKTPGTAGNATTPRAQEYENWLKAKLDKAGKFTVTMVNPWGCVMGIRTGANWTFYLQENATVICNHVTKTGVDQKYYARPMYIRQIYPGNGGIASMRMKVPVTVS